MADRDDRRDRGDRDRSRRREPRFLITSFEVSDPVKEGDSWGLNAVAVAVFRDERGSRPPDPQRNILFDVGGADVGTPQPTGRRNGRASIDFTLSEPGSYLVGAQIEDMPATRVTQKVVIKAERPKTPEEQKLARTKNLVEVAKVERELNELQVLSGPKLQLEQAKLTKESEETRIKPKTPTDFKVYAHPEGPAQEYFVSVEIWGDDKVGIKQWPVEIKDVAHPDVNKRSAVVRIGDDGAHRFRIDTTGPREIFISVVGTPLDYVLRLAGPRNKSTAPKVPDDVPQKVLDKGFKVTLQWYKERAARETQKEKEKKK